VSFVGFTTGAGCQAVCCDVVWEESLRAESALPAHPTQGTHARLLACRHLPEQHSQRGAALWHHGRRSDHRQGPIPSSRACLPCACGGPAGASHAAPEGGLGVTRPHGLAWAALPAGRVLIGQGAIDACKIGLAIAIRYSTDRCGRRAARCAAPHRQLLGSCAPGFLTHDFILCVGTTMPVITLPALLQQGSLWPDALIMPL